MKTLCASIVTAISLCTGCMNSLDEGIPPVASELGLLRSVVVNGRIFYYAEPLLPPPAGGYPVIMLFHGGDGYAADWIEIQGLPNGMTVIGLARRYFIIAPESGVSDEGSGTVTDVKKRWNTAVNSGDIPYILDILAWIPRSGYPVNMGRIFLAGISSGGAMVSRMAQTTPWLFARLAIVASMNPSYSPYWESTVIVSAEHPSTAFIHGTADWAVPIERMREYYNGIPAVPAAMGDCDFTDGGAKVKMKCEVAGGGHTWFGQYNSSIYDWFDAAPQ